jgi:Zn-finger nucleic acid-binding protein
MDDYSVIRDEYIYAKLKEEAFKNIQEIQKPETAHPVKEGESNPERDEQARREARETQERHSAESSGENQIRPASRQLHCPLHACRMKTAAIEEIVIDYCPKCYGMWLDFGELERLFHKNLEKNTLFRNTLSKQVEKPPHDTVIRKCPLCREPMEKKKHYEDNLYLDICPNCGGIWLDSGEFALLYLANREENSIQHILAGIIGKYIDISV